VPHAQPTGSHSGSVGPAAAFVASVAPSGVVEARSITDRHYGASYYPRADWISIPNLTPDPQGEFDVIAGGSLTPVSAGVTFYLGLFGSLTESLVSIPMPACTITELRCRVTVAPGAGKTHTYTLRKNGSDQASLVASIADSAEEASDTGAVTFSAGDKLSVKLVTEAAAEQAYHLWSVKLQLAS
jgi:hypothetical protein